MYLHAVKPRKGWTGRAALPGGLLFLVSCVVTVTAGSVPGLLTFVILGTLWSLARATGKRHSSHANVAARVC
jgi:hypothetical protein